jgi:hypothetical protein
LTRRDRDAIITSAIFTRSPAPNSGIDGNSLEADLDRSALGFAAWLATDQTSPSGRAERNEELLRMVEALADLPELMREVFDHETRGLLLFHSVVIVDQGPADHVGAWPGVSAVHDGLVPLVLDTSSGVISAVASAASGSGHCRLTVELV